MNDVSTQCSAAAEFAVQSASSCTLVRAELVEVAKSGLLVVRSEDGVLYSCEVLEAVQCRPPLGSGDRLLVLAPPGSDKAVVLGRIGLYVAPRSEAHLSIEASESLTLKCGAASIDLRADGKVMVRGEDVLLRAKGTQRIRAGTVSIN